MESQITVKDLYFCYSRKVMMYLKNNGFRFILCAYHETSQQKFWMFERSHKLDEALGGYKN